MPPSRIPTQRLDLFQVWKGSFIDFKTNVDHLVLEIARDPLHVTPDSSNGTTRDVARKTI